MADREQTDKKYLLKLIEKSNFRLFTVLRSVSRSGMSRVIAVFAIPQNKKIASEPVDITRVVATALERKTKQTDCGTGIVVSGCGVDIGFELVYSLSQVLYGFKDPGGYKITQRWL